MGDHTESLEVAFDPRATSFAALLELFWSSHDPTRRAYSRQYMSAVFCLSEAQERAVKESVPRWESRLGRAISTRVQRIDVFWRAEDYHQKYYLQSDRVLMREFRAYEEQEFVDSTVAAKLNGFVGGEGSEELLAAELDSLGISREGGDHLKKVVARSGRSW